MQVQYQHLSADLKMDDEESSDSINQHKSFFFPFFFLLYLKEYYSKFERAIYQNQVSMIGADALYCIYILLLYDRVNSSLKYQRTNQPKKLLVTIDSFFPLGSSVEKMSASLQSTTY